MSVYIHESMESPGSSASAQAARVFWDGRYPRSSSEFSHLVADSESELREYARKIGIVSGWIHHPGAYDAHIYVTGAWLSRIRLDPAVKKITLHEFAQLLRTKQKEARNASA